MKDKTTRYMAYGGAAALVIALATGVAVSIQPNQVPIATEADPLDVALQKKLEEIRQAREETEEKVRRQGALAQRASAQARTEKNRASSTDISKPRKNTPSATKQGSAPVEPVVTSLEPTQKKIDMENVGSLSISQNSSNAEIVRVIEAYNARQSGKKK